MQLLGVRSLDAHSNVESFDHVFDRDQVAIDCLINRCRDLHTVSLVPSVVKLMQRQGLCAIELGCIPRSGLRGEWVWVGAHVTSNICHRGGVPVAKFCALHVDTVSQSRSAGDWSEKAQVPLRMNGGWQ